MTQKSFSPEEVSTRLGVSMPTVHRKMKSGELPSGKVGARRIITMIDLEKFIGRERAWSVFGPDNEPYDVLKDMRDRDPSVGEMTINSLIETAPGGS